MRGRILKNIDKITLLVYLLLILMGLFSIYSSAFSEKYPEIYSQKTEYGKQLMWIGISCFIGFCILLIEGSFIRKNAYYFYAITVALLVLVLIVGSERNGAKAWFGFGSFGIQPAEFSKIAVSLALAKYTTSLGIRFDTLESKIKLLGLIALPIILILLQPDLGSVLVFAAFVLVLYRIGLLGNALLYGFLFAAIGIVSIIYKEIKEIDLFEFHLPISSTIFIMGVIALILIFIMSGVNSFSLKRYRKKRLKRILLVGSLCLITVPTSQYIFNKLPNNYQKQRFEVTLGLREDPKGVGYNIKQSLSAIGSGRFSGKGYKNATLANNKFKHVPEQSTDFIFCTIAEEFGFIGSATLIFLSCFLLLRILIIAERQRSNFTTVYAYCVACILFMHYTINLGMVIGLAPIIGIPLPFFSYGGSSLLAFSIMIFILLRLDAERMDVLR